MFKDEWVWIIDDSNVYWVVGTKNLEGNLSTSPVNGALFVFDP